MATEKQALYLTDLAQVYRAEAARLGFDFDALEVLGEDGYVDYKATSEKILHDVRPKDAHKLISGLLEYAEGWTTRRPTSKQAVITQFAFQWARDQGRTRIGNRDYDRILAWVESKHHLQGDFRPLVFAENPGGGEQRVPVTLTAARDKFRKQISAVLSVVNKRLADLEEQHHDQELDDEQQQGIEQEHDQNLLEEDQEESQQQGEIEEQRENELPRAAEEYWTRYVQVREYTESRDVGGHKIDTLERRPYKAAVGMIIEEIPNEAIFWAMCMHYPESVRRDLNITEYDVRSFKPERRVDGLPPEFPYLDALCRQRIWPWQISPAGVGKTYNVGAMANHYGQPHCVIPLNLGTSPSVFNGRPKLNNTALMVEFLDAMGKQDEERMTSISKRAKEDGDVAISEFTKVFRSGGHILLDELDRAVEGILMILNAPLANHIFVNTAEGKTYDGHPDTIFWAASNTDGLGVSATNREYRAANALDFATIDRFRMGRVKMKGDIDEYRKDFESMLLARMG